MGSLDADILRKLLEDAQSVQPELIRQAESSLRVAESQPGFGHLLAQYISRHDLPESDRQLSAILLRKFVKHHWDADADHFEVHAYP